MAAWSPAEAVTADPKPAKRIKANKAEWERIRARFAHACCVSCGLPYQHLHHIAFRKADSGDDVVSNLAPMCNSCHERFHRHGIGWERIAAAVRQYVMVDNQRRRYAEAKLGGRFNQRYPCPPHPDQEQVRADMQTIYGVTGPAGLEDEPDRVDPWEIEWEPREPEEWI